MREDNSLPFCLDDDFSELIDFEKYCPGVYYVVGQRFDEPMPSEYYVVHKEQAPLSDAAKAYGEVADSDPNLLIYRMDDPESGRTIVTYEVQKYLSSHKLPLLENEDVLMTAIYGMEYHPDYFGDFPVPPMTPRGAVTRCKRVSCGVFALETESFERMIAVCHPVWSCDLSDYTVRQAEMLDSDLRQGIDSTLGNLFFPESSGCLALFELWRFYDEIMASGLIDWEAMMNAIYLNHPEYAVRHNRREQDGLNDVGAQFWRWLGFDVEPEGEEENLIRFNPEKGANYLLF